MAHRFYLTPAKYTIYTPGASELVQSVLTRVCADLGLNSARYDISGTISTQKVILKPEDGFLHSISGIGLKPNEIYSVS